MNTPIDHTALTNPTTLAQAILDGTVHGQYAWAATTNVRQCGGFTARGKAIVHHALRKKGFVFFLALDTTDGNHRGIIHRDQLGHEKIFCDRLITGYTLNHVAHKLGNGNAKVGWKIFHSN